ncbi:hypothetical protein [Streptomyces mirabilis]|uniref:hypothetical protein n=2 Tax=Streptomyces mirabilis TaxID=68239 RepID=UPI0033B32607
MIKDLPLECRICGRRVAAGMVAGRPCKGHLWRHDPLQMRSLYGGSLVSCIGSLGVVDLPKPGEQLRLFAVEEPADVQNAADDVESMALF